MLQLDGIRKSFAATLALDAIDLTVATGQIHALLGPNGAGKSTTVSIAAGLLAPDRGSATINNQPVTHHATRDALGVAPQHTGLYLDLSASENLILFASLHAHRPRPLRQRCEDALDAVGLLPHAHRRVAEFSEGMRRRLNLAAAIAHQPAVLILDEPTAGVDPHSRQLIFDIVNNQARRGAAVLYTTHLMDEAQRLAHQVTIIDRGRVIASGSPTQLITSLGGHTRVTIQTAEHSTTFPTDQPVQAIADALSRSTVSHIELAAPSLEDVFFSLTGRSLRE